MKKRRSKKNKPHPKLEFKIKQIKNPWLVFPIIVMAEFVLMYSLLINGWFPNMPDHPKEQTPSLPNFTQNSVAKDNSQKQDNFYKLVLYNESGENPSILATFANKYHEAYPDIIPVRKDDNIYIVDTDTITEYSLLNKTSHIVFKNSKENTSIVQIVFGNSGYLYVTFSPYGHSTKHNSAEIFEVDISSGKTIRRLADFQFRPFDTVNYLFQSQGFDIVQSQGGDGCTAVGILARYKNGTTTPITQYGIGCNEYPRYLGFNEKTNQLIMAAILPNSLKRSSFRSFVKYDVLYEQNVLTGEITPLYDLKTISGLQDVLLTEDKTSALLVNETNTNIVDLSKKTIIKTLPPVNYKGYESMKIQDNELIVLDFEKDKMLIMDLDSGKIKVQPQQGINIYFLLGKWNNQYLFMPKS